MTEKKDTPKEILYCLTNISQKDIAEKLNLSYSTLRKVVNLPQSKHQISTLSQEFIDLYKSHIKDLYRDELNKKMEDFLNINEYNFDILVQVYKILEEEIKNHKNNITNLIKLQTYIRRQDSKLLSSLLIKIRKQIIENSLIELSKLTEEVPQKKEFFWNLEIIKNFI